MRKELYVDLGVNSYSIFIERGSLSSLGKEIKRFHKGGKVFLLTDENVALYYGAQAEAALTEAGYQVRLLAVPAGESSKSFTMLESLYDAMLDFTLTRKDLVVTMGGGVVGDLGGFAASTYLRGVPFVQVPTSLLAQVDSSVGGKVAVDLPQGKNLVGSFYQPKAVFIDPDVLSTLPERFFRDGMGEVIKYGCIKDQAFFEKLAVLSGREAVMADIEEVLYRCCDLKRQVVEQDERDMGERMLLNFGHTLGHAIETQLGYQKLTHGEGVAIGMYQVTRRSEEKGLTAQGTAERIRQALAQYQLPWEYPGLDEEKLLTTISVDKKNLNSNLNVVLLKEIGSSFLHQTSLDFFRRQNL